MNYFTLFPLQGHWGKWFGAVIVGIAAIAGVIDPVLGYPFIEMEPRLRTQTVLWVLGLGLCLMTFSQERLEDERVRQVRYTALKGALMIALYMALFLSFPMLWRREDHFFTTPEAGPMTVMIGVIIPLLIYQIVFHIGLRSDPQWVYNDGSVEENVRRYPKLIYLAIIGASVLLATVLMKML